MRAHVSAQGRRSSEQTQRGGSSSGCSTQPQHTAASPQRSARQSRSPGVGSRARCRVCTPCSCQQQCTPLQLPAARAGRPAHPCAQPTGGGCQGRQPPCRVAGRSEQPRRAEGPLARRRPALGGASLPWHPPPPPPRPPPLMCAGCAPTHARAAPGGASKGGIAGRKCRRRAPGQLSTRSLPGHDKRGGEAERGGFGARRQRMERQSPHSPARRTPPAQLHSLCAPARPGSAPEPSGRRSLGHAVTGLPPASSASSSPHVFGLTRRTPPARMTSGAASGGGATAGRYQLLELIGRGSFGDVYRG